MWNNLESMTRSDEQRYSQLEWIYEQFFTAIEILLGGDGV